MKVAGRRGRVTEAGVSSSEVILDDFEYVGAVVLGLCSSRGC